MGASAGFYPDGQGSLKTEQRERLTGGEGSQRRGGKAGAERSGRASSLGTEKCVQISTYILVQHLSCAVLFCILCERLQKNVVAFIAKLLNCLTE